MVRGTAVRWPAAKLRDGALVLGVSSFLVGWSGLAWAAPPAGVVEGIAKDSLARALSGAQLRLETPDGQVLGRTAADAQGHFSFSGIAPGTYAVVAENQGFDPATAIVTVGASEGASAELTLPARAALDLNVVAQRLEEARIAIQPRIGASTYSITDAAIQNQPGGENAPLNQVILRAPGVSQDSAASGEFHVRNEHANVQYRINGIILPEGLSSFGQTLSPRFASSVDLITGALPAQYGLRTSGIIDVQTKSGAFEPGGSISVYGGSYGRLQEGAEYGGSYGRLNYFVSGDYLQSGLGLEAPTGSYNALHDDTQQGHGFAYLDYVIDATSKVSAILGTYRGTFQIPNIPGQTPTNTVNGSAAFDSAALNQNQRESSTYGVLSYLKSGTNYDVQVSGFSRYSSLTYHPDPALGDLAFNGISQDAYRRSIATGIQTDSSFKITPTHTLRTGFTVTGERTIARTNSLVEAAGGPDTPFLLSDSTGKTGWTYGLYLQDEWHATSWLTINYGGRFDVVDAYTHENQISPRINAVIQATKTTTLHAGYARYFTPPPFELASNTNVAQFVGTTGEPPGVANGNSTVKAERADYFDVGVSQLIIPGLKAGLDAYYKHSHNLIDEGQFGAPIILTAFNYRTARNIGIELTTTYDVKNFSFYGNLAIAQQKAKDIVSGQFNFDPGDLAFIATNAIHTDHDQLMTASAGASYFLHDTRFSVDVLAGSGLRAGGSTPNGHALPSYEQVNFGVGQKLDLPRAGKIELRLDLVNVLDEVYVIRNGTGVGVGAPQFGPRRSVYAGMKKEF
ncbi:MAG: Outer rane receptor protein mostly Fe transport [Rhodospirillales bacterium]|nr:Outer rane receptor protein mostly Fe transport [Rhodospirillales bacterium]